MCVICVIEISHAVDLSRVLYVCDLCYCMCVTCVIVYVCALCTRNIICCRPVLNLVSVCLSYCMVQLDLNFEHMCRKHACIL